jgi:pSer/pThr/pTyr-binding forkhead associated (FHA) protein
MAGPSWIEVYSVGRMVTSVRVRKAETTIGRHQDCEIVLDDRSLGRFHARIQWDGSLYRILDLGSQNGTMVNGVRVTEPRPLLVGDVIALGRFHVVLTGGAPPEAESPFEEDTAEPDAFAEDTAPLIEGKGSDVEPGQTRNVAVWARLKPGS